MKKYVAAAAVLAGFAFGAPAMAQTKPTIAVIVKDTTSFYWKTVLAGARKAGQTSSNSAHDPNPTQLVK